MSLLDKYQHIRLIGEGGFAIVQEYEHTSSGQHVALKRLKPEHYGNPDYIHRFCREIEILQLLSTHRNVIKLLGSSQTPDLYAYIMPKATMNLQKYIETKNSSLELERRLSIFERILSAIHYAHTNGILHRDISPNNVLLFNKSGIMEVMVSDFGLGKSVETYADITRSSAASFGQVYYVSPEQREKLKAATFRSDIFSLGKLLNFILTGRTPDIIHQSEFTPVIKKATAYNPEDRFATIEEFQQEYKTFKALLLSEALPIKAELARLASSDKVDWRRIHKSLLLAHTEQRVYDDYIEPTLLLFSRQDALQEYYGKVGSLIGEFAAKFLQKVNDLPAVGWPFSSMDDCGKLFADIFVLVKESDTKLECLKGLWYCGYSKNQSDVQGLLRQILENHSIPRDIQSEFADYILKSDVARRRLQVAYSELVKLELPPSIRNAIISKSGG